MKSIKKCSTCKKICIHNYYKCKCGYIFCYLHKNKGHLYYFPNMKPDCEYFHRNKNIKSF